MRLAVVQKFMQLESASSIILLAAAIVALLVSNSPLAPLYATFLKVPFGISLGEYSLIKPMILWINDGLMAIFFFLIGLEIKREILEGELSSVAQIALPGFAALGGMAAPALIYCALNWQHPENLPGWAIPAATDIAFAVGILGLAGSRVPLSLKIFLLALAILDDLGAIVIIAFFYTENLSLISLALAGLGLLALIVLNRCNVTSLAAYVLIGIFMWVCVLKSGVHATLAGVALAFTIPIRDRRRPDRSMLRRCEHALHPWVGFAIMPIFAFANAGVGLQGMGLTIATEPVGLGIALGLFIGKQLGVMLMVVLCVSLGFARLPQGASWSQMYGVAILTGIGFTMSLFIGTLAFGDNLRAAEVRLGVLAGSILSGVIGYLVLRYMARPLPAAADATAGLSSR
ncbi:MAG: Na+/H+ antiporter NhaA [Rhodospirillaceae bacterium]|nr:MAG: Na+/H+ antiporter NhaA [Rhodospirillaceae bacterium]